MIRFSTKLWRGVATAAVISALSTGLEAQSWLEKQVHNAGSAISGAAHHAGGVISSGAKHAGGVVSGGTHHAGGVVSSGAKHTGSVLSGTAHQAGGTISSGAKHAGGVISGGVHHAGGVVNLGVKHAGGVASGTLKPLAQNLVKTANPATQLVLTPRPLSTLPPLTKSSSNLLKQQFADIKNTENQVIASFHDLAGGLLPASPGILPGLPSGSNAQTKPSNPQPSQNVPSPGVDNEQTISTSGPYIAPIRKPTTDDPSLNQAATLALGASIVNLVSNGISMENLSPSVLPPENVPVGIGSNIQYVPAPYYPQPTTPIPALPTPSPAPLAVEPSVYTYRISNLTETPCTYSIRGDGTQWGTYTLKPGQRHAFEVAHAEMAVRYSTGGNQTIVQVPGQHDYAFASDAGGLGFFLADDADSSSETAN